MDVHRCRFVPFPPSTINAVAFSHSHISKDQKTAPPRLAIGRANGDIEIWNPLRGSWLQETTIRGGKDRSIDGLVWIQDPNEDLQGKTFIGKSRLFSIGYTTTVTEWDLEKGRPLRQASGSHGAIWCLAAQPPLPHTPAEANGDFTNQWRGQNLITGCTDGALVLYSTKDDGLELQRVLVRPSSKKAKIISVTFQDRNIVVAGCSDSTIRLYDIRNGSLIRNMTLGSGPKGGPKEIIVWSVKVLKNKDIISGDSTGELKIWDGKTYTLMQRVKSHRQDTLSLATSSDGSTIFSGGMDRRTVIYKPGGKGKNRWEEVSHRRFHNNDVKTMASFEGHGMSVVVSGGSDASPTVVPLGQYGFETQRSLPFLPQESTIRSAPRKRLMMSWWEREVHIWRLSKYTQPLIEDQDEEPEAKNRKLIAKVLVEGEENITSAALSADGSLLAVSTTAGVKLFQLRKKKPEDGEGLKVSKIAVPTAFSSGARLVEFSPDSKWLSIVRPNSHITVARIISSVSSPITVHPQISKVSRLDRKIEKFISLGGLGAYDRTITQVAFSSDSRILAVSDLAGYVDTFVLSGHEDLTQTPSNSHSFDASSSSSSSESESSSSEAESAKQKLTFGQHWTRNPLASSLPKLTTTPVILSFRPASNPSQNQATNGNSPHPTRNNPNPISHELPAGEDRLFIMTATSEVYEFSVLKGALSPWSRRNPSSVFPETFRKVRDQAKGAFWDVTAGKERIWLYGVGWLWMFDLSRDLPPPKGEDLANGATPSKKRKRNKGTGAGNEVRESELNTGLKKKMNTYLHDAYITEHQITPKLDADIVDIDDEDDDENASSLALEKLRRGQQVKDDEGPPHEWFTYKYRPILGVCVIGDESELEIAVVERPLWDADNLPGAVYGDQEWEARDL